MQLKQHRKMILAITIGYTLLILYFLFFAFGRLGKVDQITECTFIFLPDNFFRLPGLSDLLHPTLMDLVGFGNIAAFIPFGILIPLLFRTHFIRFMAWFILSILVLETIQALTFLGSFDINDVIQNASGAAIGFGAYRLGFRMRNDWSNVVATGVYSIVLMLGVWGGFGLVDQAFTREMGPIVAIDELKDSNRNPSTGTRRYSLKISSPNVEPRYTWGNKEELFHLFPQGNNIK